MWCSSFWIGSDSTQLDNRHLNITVFHMDCYRQLKRSKAYKNDKRGYAILCMTNHDTVS